MKEADRDRLGAAVAHRLHDAIDLGIGQLDMDLAIGEHPLLRLERTRARDEGVGPVEQEIIGFGPVLTPDLVDVARALRDDQSGLGAGLLDRDVDGDGRAVHQGLGVLGLQFGLGQAIPHALREFRRRRELLGLDDLSGRRIECDQIGERAPDIDSDFHAISPPHCLSAFYCIHLRASQRT